MHICARTISVAKCVLVCAILPPHFICIFTEKSKVKDEDSNGEENSDAEDEGKYARGGR